MMTNLNMTSTTRLPVTNTPSISMATGPITPPDELLSQITPPCSLLRHPLSNSENSPAATVPNNFLITKLTTPLKTPQLIPNRPQNARSDLSAPNFQAQSPPPANKEQSSLASLFFFSPLSLTPSRIPKISTHNLGPPPEGGGGEPE